MKCLTLKILSLGASFLFSFAAVSGSSFVYAAEKTTKEKIDKKESDGSDVDSPDKWPSKVAVPKGMRLKEVPEKKSGLEGYTYESNNYRFNSDAPLTEAAQKSIGRLFECAFAANKAIAKVLPIPRAKAYRPSKNKFQARFYKSTRDYEYESGVEGSLGYYRFNMHEAKKLSEKYMEADEVLVPFESLGLSEDGKLLDKKVESRTLVHELTHQCTIFNQLPVWIDEGLAEYVGYVPYDGKHLDFDQCFVAILKLARERQADLEYPFTFEEFLLMPQDEMINYMVHDVDTYLLSTLCVAYFVHLEGKNGVRALQNYMKELIKGVANEKAIKKLYGNHKSPESMQKRFLKVWEARGVRINFKAKP